MSEYKRGKNGRPPKGPRPGPRAGKTNNWRSVLSGLINDIHKIASTFPGSWARQTGCSTLDLPGCTMTVGASGFSGSGGPLRVYVQIIRADAPPVAPIPFSRSIDRHGGTTAYPPSAPRLAYRDPGQWLRDSLTEAYEWLEMVEGIEVTG